MSSPLGPAAPGDVIAWRYRIESWLGQGNMAVVYRATHLGTGQPCALKLVHPHLVERSEIRDLFVQEARVGARIGKNPHIVDVFDAGIDPQRGVPYLAMELLEGDTLDKYVKQRGPVPPGLLRMLFLQLADALGQAHAAGVVHRDLKPGNLFLTYDRKKAPLLKVVDFGIAKVMEEGVQGTATQVGSPAYAAPEQLGVAMRPMTDKMGIVIEHRISPATDIWALGVIAYELLLGAPPGHLWTGAGRGTIADIMMGVAINPTPSVLERAGAKAHLFPRGFDEWLDRCLRKNANERWSSVEEAVRNLAELLDGGYEDGETQQIMPRHLGIGRKSPMLVTMPLVAPKPPAEQAPSHTAILPQGFHPASEATAPPPPQAQATPPAAVKGANTRTLPLSNSLAHERPAPLPPEPSSAKRSSSGNVRTVLLDLPPAPQPPPPALRASLPSQHELAPQPAQHELAPPPALRASQPSQHELAPLPSPPALRASQPSQHEVPQAAATAHGLAGTSPPAQREAKRGVGLVLGGVALFGAVGLAVFTLMPKKGRLVIDVSDAGNTKVEVFVDGTKRCDTVPCVVGDVAPGARTIKVLPQGAAPLPPQEAIVERGEDKPVTFSMVAQSHEGATSATAHAPGAISEVKPIETAPLTPPPEAPPPPAPDGSTTPPPQLPTQEGLTPSARPTSTPASAPAQGNGTLNINSIPVSKVILDGRPLGNTPRVGLSVPPGTHTVVFVHPEKGRQTVSISVKPGETKTAAVKFR